MSAEQHPCSRLMGLCRELLSQNEALVARLDRLYDEARQIAVAYRELRERVDRKRHDQAAEVAAGEVLFAAALDLLQERGAA
jgi:hypothetical protein